MLQRLTPLAVTAVWLWGLFGWGSGGHPSRPNLVVILSDHGEGFWEHGFAEHGNTSSTSCCTFRCLG